MHRMVRGGRLVGVIAGVVVVLVGPGGCGRFDDRPVDVAPPATAGDCVVGSWKQTEGWQRIATDDLVTDLRLITGGRTFQVRPDGTASFEYLNPTRWQNTGVGDDLEVVYAGTVTMTYTAKDGAWTETADATGATTTLTLNKKADTPRAGATGRVTKATYVCDEGNLILTGDAFRQAFTRA
jgi:hypothetical protein